MIKGKTIFRCTNCHKVFVGIDVDILAAIAEDQGFEYELQSLGWDAAVAAVQAGQADRQNRDSRRTRELEAEVRALRKQLAEKDEVIDVLKKSVGILSRP